MNTDQKALYKRIQDFSVDHPNSEFPLSQRLAQENGWTIDYTHQAISEYKKFTFLAVVTDHPVAPSDPVDQVWHLHLLYTHSYWDEFCPNVLQQSLHHGPTQGGRTEQEKFQDWYAKTLSSYVTFFGEPPRNIWSSPEERFKTHTAFVRIDTNASWILPKLWSTLNLSWLIPCAIVLLGLTAYTPLSSINTWNPLNFNGPEFLRFYLVVIAVGIATALSLRFYLQQPEPIGSASPELDIYEAAYLAEGSYRAVNTAIVNLVQRGQVQLDQQSRSLELLANFHESNHALEQAIRQAIATDNNIEHVQTSVLPIAMEISRDLEGRGILLDERQSKQFRLYPASVIFAVLLLGTSKCFIGIERHKPIGYLMLLCLAVLYVGFMFLAKRFLYRSRLGNRLLNALRTQYSHFRRKKRAEESSQSLPEHVMAFALFGSSVLAGSSLADMGKVLAPISPLRTSRFSDSSGCAGGCNSCGSGCGSSCGSGCGGGCGGCGGG
ncbi:TIGR04222 domain-containing membrane protein [Acaryochloris sp. CCMEE 5410]|uniref:TIGR04222 domain-containing membrane protein n=1 Tax=Acaryochloris sp. CCMEE 5410 TaxID=310037 RepID=UPI00024839BE|nr:TIGR04222 domain-containing membrane protein [Acaryochloris sp. CCMEE 5410]KAI9133048.1 TIGR04222 domain-containing membrane protein [Acaryochloris sp. CCMEE 5410]